MHSLNKVDDNIKKIGALFPNCVTERKNDAGEVEYAIDFDMLKQELSSVVVEGKEERYQFTWPDKKKSILAANAPITKTLRPVRVDETVPTGEDSNGKPYLSSGSVDFDTTQNLYIEGDNLAVLKLLQETYLGKIKMIYIDPPYNTGNDFVYNDDFAESAEEYLAHSGQFDEEGNRLVANTESNGRFHTDWLNMIYPRLKLAKDLLADDGVIFISIDDNEIENLKKMCNEVFGDLNAAFPFIWLLPRGINAGLVARSHEYVLVYTKNSLITKTFNRISTEQEYSIERCNKKIDSRHPESIIEFPAGIRYEGKDQVLEGIIEGSEQITIIGKMVFRDGRLAEPVKLSAGWTMKNMILDWLSGKTVTDLKGQVIDEFFFKENGKLYSKKALSTETIKSVLKDIPDTQIARKEMEALFGSQDIFSYPKTIELARLFAKLTTTTEDIVLDFFSGSATTAHAVMQLNAEDGGNRKFIMVQLPEETDEKSEAYKAGYKNICEIGKERIRRAGAKIKADRTIKIDVDKSQLMQRTLLDDGTFDDKYALKVTPANDDDVLDNLDTGFRVLKLDSSNMKDVYYTPDDYEINMFDMLSDNIKEDRTPEDLLFQVMLDLGVLLSSKIEEEVISGKKVFNVADGFLYACFDNNVSEETITAIAKKKPYYFVMRDSSMANDSVATNFDQIFATYSPDTERKVL